jgi:hypothetical protein
MSSERSSGTMPGPMAVDDDPERALDTAVRLIGAALAEVGVPREKLLGPGFACPVDEGRQRLHAEGIMTGWIGVQPVDELAGRTGCRYRSSTTRTPAYSPSGVSAPHEAATTWSTCACPRASTLARPSGDAQQPQTGDNNARKPGQ